MVGRSVTPHGAGCPLPGLPRARERHNRRGMAACAQVREDQGLDTLSEPIYHIVIGGYDNIRRMSDARVIMSVLWLFLPLCGDLLLLWLFLPSGLIGLLSCPGWCPPLQADAQPGAQGPGYE